MKRDLAYWKGRVQDSNLCVKYGGGMEYRWEMERAVIHAKRRVRQIERDIGIGESEDNMRYYKEYSIIENQRRQRELEAKQARVIWWAIVVLSLMVLGTIVWKG